MSRPGLISPARIVLKSNVNFHLESGATILGSKDLADYKPLANDAGPKLKGDANAKHLIFARDAENLTISGNGHVNGQGPSFWVPSERKVPPPEDAWRDVATYDWKPLDRASPMVELFNCKNVRVEDVTFENAVRLDLPAHRMRHAGDPRTQNPQPGDRTQHRRHRPHLLPQRLDLRLRYRDRRRRHLPEERKSRTA